MIRARVPCALLALAALAACSAQPPRPEAPRDEPRAKSGNPPFYEVAGRRYVVLESAAGYVERGVASWYGPDFHGRRTATGETYDMHAMTGAHPTLPLPTWVRVTNLENGRSVDLRLNDRGPFAKNRIIDLSRAAAEKLGMIGSGTALVEVQSLAGGAPPAPAAAPPAPAARFFAQAGAFADEDNARRLAARLADAGVTGVEVTEARVDGRRLFRVRAGPVGSVAGFDALVERLRAAGVESPRLALQ
ncbi:MAG: septal ring lytic transglycosylase RlpA family protein [Gammaproteobacteria bacterium]